MAKLASPQCLLAENFLTNKARKLDHCAYLHFKHEQSKDTLLRELKAFQNHDGGFGHGMEPDLQLPASSILATTFALQYAVEFGLTHTPLFKQAIQYLVSQIKSEEQFSYWDIIPHEAEQFPRAPWWNYASPTTFNANPSLEVIAYLLCDEEDSTINRAQLDALTAYAVNYILAKPSTEQHELLCMLRLYDCLPAHLQGVVYSALCQIILQAVETNSDNWHHYTLTPLHVIHSPSSPFSSLFDSKLIEHNLAHIVNTQMADGSWHPAWSWGQFDAEWAKAKLDWQGILTRKNLTLLHHFNYIDNVNM